MTASHLRTVDVRQAPWKSLGLLAAGVVMTGISFFVTTLEVGRRGQALSQIERYLYGTLGWFGVLFFGAATVVILWRSFVLRGPVISVAPAGIWDRRVTRAPVPWSAITGVSTWSFQGQDIIVLAIDPATEKTIVTTAIARWTRGANAALGANGLSIATTGLTTSHDEFLSIITAHIENARR